MKHTIFFILIQLVITTAFSQQQPLRWNIADDGGILWAIKSGEKHNDNIEMTGKQLSVIVTYGTDSLGHLLLSKRVIFPMLRTIPNKSRSHTSLEFNSRVLPPIKVNGTDVIEFPSSVHLKGVVTMRCKTNTDLVSERVIFPSTDKALMVEWCKLSNPSKTPVIVEILKGGTEIVTDSSKGVDGKYIFSVDVDKEGKFTIDTGETLSYCISYTGRLACEHLSYVSPAFELAKRKELINDVMQSLVLQTPDDTLNRAFAFAKIRGTESIYETKGGLMHSPGGVYHAAIWANDQAEYINPFFPFLGNINGIESALNCYRHFASYMNDEYKQLPSAVLAEGVIGWTGHGDRGDQAMIAYGASRFALAYGDKETAKILWPLIEWCIEYLERKKTPQGVIASDSDELEGRYPTGKVNLSTNALAYGGLVSAANLAKEFNLPEKAELYAKRAAVLRADMEKYFGANVQGFNTYRYFDNHGKADLLRAWICLPLTMGIYDRREETLKALFSDHLWTENGILTQSGSSSFWDRATLYAFRALFAAGVTETGMKYFKFYSAKRLLGDHVPYPVEAWPEGNQRHLSAESGLYCRVVTEGLFDIDPLGFNKFNLKPILPEGWKYMSLKRIKAFGSDFNIDVQKAGKATKILITDISGKKLFETSWDGRQPVTVVLP